MVYPIRTRSCEDACNKITWGIRVFGMLPMNKRFQLDPILIAVSLLLMVILLANTAYWMFSRMMNAEGLYHYILYLSRKILETLTVIVIIVQFLVKRDRFRSIVYNLKTVECALTEVGQHWSWSIQPRHYLRLPLLTVLLILLPYNVWSDSYYWSAMHIEIFFIGIYVSHVCAFYDMLKYSLTQIRTTEECTSDTKLYNMVESSFEDLNAINGFGIFMMLFCYFLNLLHQVYQLLNIDGIPWNRYTDIYCTAAYNISFILWIILTCNGVSSEAKRFNAGLYNKVTQNNIENLKYDDIIFHFAMKKGLQFEANGFFSVNNSLICSMIVTGTTYLVILLQWSPRVPQSQL